MQFYILYITFLHPRRISLWLKKHTRELQKSFGPWKLGIISQKLSGFWPKHWAFSPGFTLIELLVVMAIAGMLLGLTMVYLLPFQDRTMLSSAVDIMLTDIKQQQLKAMIGDTAGGGAREAYGVYFQTNSYTVYPGASYSASNPKNFTVPIESPISITDTLPNNTLTFASGSGEIVNFVPGNNTVTVHMSVAGEQTEITFNKYGTVVSVD